MGLDRFIPPGQSLGGYLNCVHACKFLALIKTGPSASCSCPLVASQRTPKFSNRECPWLKLMLSSLSPTMQLMKATWRKTGIKFRAACLHERRHCVE